MAKIKLLYDIEQLLVSKGKETGICRMSLEVLKRISKKEDYEVYPVVTVKKGNDPELYLEKNEDYPRFLAKFIFTGCVLDIMRIQPSNNSINHKSMTKRQMAAWRRLNRLPDYINATYTGYTGAKLKRFPTVKFLAPSAFEDITVDLLKFEEDVLQQLKNTRQKPFGYVRALWAMGQNLGTGASWDTKFLPKFPGRDKFGRVQYGIYNGEVVTGNDVSNIFFGHLCAYMGFPAKIAQLLARMDACGVFEIFSKGRLPNLQLMSFRDTKSDQAAIKKGVKEFDLGKYRCFGNRHGKIYQKR